MSIVTVSYDTKEKTCQVQIDGQELSQARRVEFYNYSNDDEEAEWHFNAEMYAFDKMTDMRHSYQLSAKLNPEGIKVIQAGAKDSALPDFVIRHIEKPLAEQVKSFVMGAKQ